MKFLQSGWPGSLNLWLKKPLSLFTEFLQAGQGRGEQLHHEPQRRAAGVWVQRRLRVYH